MTATHSLVSPVVDQDWRRACRMAHAFGAAAAGAVVLLLVLASQFRTAPVPFPVLLAAGLAFAAAWGLAADLVVRPAGVRLDGGWLTVSRLGHGHRVHIDDLVGLSPNPHVAGCVVLVDQAGNLAEIDVRCLVRNPVIWQRIDRAVSGARRRGALELAKQEAAFWQGIVHQVTEADQHLLTALDFDPSA